nr:hypothetical protein [Tanacetum cinerariifolium]
MSTITKKVIVARADNRPPMLEKTHYNSWQSRMLLYIRGKEHGKDLLDFVLNGPFQYGTVEVPGTPTSSASTRPRTDDDLSDKEKICKEHGQDLLDSILDGPFKYGTVVVPDTSTTLESTRQRTYDDLTDKEKIRELWETDSGYAGSGARGNASGSGVNRNIGTNITNQAKVVFCYNCQGDGHMAGHCIKPKRPKNSEWFKEKMMFTQALEAMVVLDKEQMAFLAYDGFIIAIGQDTQELTITTIFQTDDLDAFDLNYNEAPPASAVLMTKVSADDSNVLSELPNLDTY